MCLNYDNRRPQGLGGVTGPNMGGRPSMLSDKEVRQLLDALENKVTDITLTRGDKQSGSIEATFKINNNQYSVDISQDGTFSALREDGHVEMRLYHDRQVFGSPLTFSYDNAQDSRVAIARNPALTSQAQQIGRGWFKTATETPLDI